MTKAIAFEPGDYRYLPGSTKFSGGVAANEGFRIVRWRFARPAPLVDGFDIIARTLSQAGRPLTALCACELRSPEPSDDAGFAQFNRTYGSILESWGLADAASSPVARSNVCPVTEPPSEPSIFAFSYTERAAGMRPSYVLSGCAEARPGPEPYAERVVCHGDVSADGMRAKARFVRGAIESRAVNLAVSLDELTGAQAYSAYDTSDLMTPDYLPAAALRVGVTLQICRPPVIGLDYELDCRAASIEYVV